MNEAHGPEARHRGEVSVRCTGTDPIQVDLRRDGSIALGFKGLDGRRSTIAVAAGSCGCNIGAFGERKSEIPDNMIYTHVMHRGGLGVKSPLDRL